MTVFVARGIYKLKLKMNSIEFVAGGQGVFAC